MHDDFVPRQSHDDYIEFRGDGYDCSPIAGRRTPSRALSASSRTLWEAAWRIWTAERRRFFRLASSEERFGEERRSTEKERLMGWQREDSQKEEWNWDRRKGDLKGSKDDSLKEEWKWGRMGLVRSLLGRRKASEQDEEELKEQDEEELKEQ